MTLRKRACIFFIFPLRVAQKKKKEKKMPPPLSLHFLLYHLYFRSAYLYEGERERKEKEEEEKRMRPTFFPLLLPRCAAPA